MLQFRDLQDGSIPIVTQPEPDLAHANSRISLLESQIAKLDALAHESFWATVENPRLLDRITQLEGELDRARDKLQRSLRSSGKTETATWRRRIGEKLIIDGLETAIISVAGIEDGDDQAVRLVVTVPEETKVFTNQSYRHIHDKDEP